MLEHAIYSVISPEGCAAILWNDPAKASDAAVALKMTAQDLLELGVIDEVIPEPLGGTHRDPPSVAARVAKALDTHIRQLQEVPLDELLVQRERKYRQMGVVAGLASEGG
jgi:acetyl-CoA carboxylase carboxyl transferase subunit alpha